MPYLEFECPVGHRTEKFFKTISEGEKTIGVTCRECATAPRSIVVTAKKVPSMPLGFGLYGDPAGYDKPSATKRFNTKTVSQKEGNGNSAG